MHAKHNHGCRQTEVVSFPGSIPKPAALQEGPQTSTEKPFPPAAARSAILWPQRRRAAGRGFAPLYLRVGLSLPHGRQAWRGPRAESHAYQRLCSTPSLWCKPAGTLCLGAWLWDGGVASGSAVAAPRAMHAGCLQLLGRRISNRSSSEEKGSEVCASGGTPTLLRSYLVRKPLLRDLCVLSALFLLSLGLF